jgi:pimeloyl-ACP methyl ester carboxylesterase
VMPALAATIGLPPALADLVIDEAHGRWGGGLNVFVTADPQLIDLAAAGLESVLPTADAGAAYPDGQPHVVPVSSGSTAAPRTLTDLIGGLARLTDDRTDGEVDVQIITTRDASGALVRRVIVDIPGTGDWDVARRTDHDVTNIGTSLRALSGEPTSYEAGVLAAMRAAGVRPTDEVLLVGHSQGGVIAVNTARDAIAGGEFNVTHVITAGAPIGGTVGALPPTVAVLALENQGDIVPETDGRPNPDRPNVTTVTVHHDHGAVVPNHDLDQSYLPGASDVEASDNPSVQAYLASIDGFLDGDTSTTQRLLITRTFP